MCKKPKGLHNRIDKCMVRIVNLINESTKYKTLASCCGHGKYNLTIVVTKGYGNPIEYLTMKEIPRKKKFYKKDSKGYYYIPETVEKNKGS